MFNDILTGKATLEPKPETESPYRKAAELPPQKFTCVVCGSVYEAAAGSTHGRCSPCFLAMVEKNTADSDRYRREAAAQMARNARSQKIVRIGLALGASALFAFIKIQMRDQQREDAAVGAGYKSYADYQAQENGPDELAAQVHDLAQDGCSCMDAMCARDKEVKLRRLMQDASPSNSASRDAIAADVSRFADCAAKLR